MRDAEWEVSRVVRMRIRRLRPNDSGFLLDAVMFSSSDPGRLPSRLLRMVIQAGVRIYGLRRRLATALAGFFALLFGYHVIFGQNGLTAYAAKRHDATQLRSEIDTLQQENSRLRSHVERLGNDPGAIEHEAREELHYTRPGEVIYTLSPDKPGR